MQKQFDGEGQTAQHDTAGTSGYLQAKSKEVTEREREGGRKGGREKGRKEGKTSTQVSDLIQKLTQSGSWT